MARLIKWILGLVGLLIGLFILAVIAVMVFIDPNDYREQIADKVQQETGRELRIDGEISFSFFPWLGLELGQLELGNAPGFADEPFAGIRRADLRVRLLPLLRMQAEVDTVALHGLTLNLHRLADGRSNWDDLAGEPSEPSETAAPSEPKQATTSPEQILEGLAIGGIEILDANVRWQDDMADQTAILSDFNLRTGQISLHRAIPLEMDARIALNEPELEARFKLDTRIGLDLANQRYRLDATRLEVDAKSALIPGEQLQLRLAADLAADLKQQTATVQGLVLNALGAELSATVDVRQILGDPAASGQFALEVKDTTALSRIAELPDDLDVRSLQGSRIASDFSVDLATQQLDMRQLLLSALGMELQLQLAVKQLIDDPAISGQLRSNEFVPRQLMERLGIEAPEMADPNTLILASISTDFQAGMNNLALSKLQLQLDQSRLTGNLSLRRFEAPVIRYQLALDEIDADRYLPPPSEEETATTASASGEAEAEAIELPLELLRSLDIDGTLHIGKAKVMNLNSDSIVKTVRAEGGLFRIHPLSANLYQGSYNGNLRFDVRQDTPRLGMDERLTGVQAGPLLKDFAGDDYISGVANLAVKMSAQGLDPEQVKRTLNGEGNFSFENGQIKGINVGHLIRQAYAAYKRQPSPVEEQRETDFTALRGNFTARNGLINISSLNARSPLFNVDGRGDVNLVSEALDLRIDTTIVGSLKDAANQEISELKGLKLPITVRGTFSNPRFGVDVESVLRARVEQAIEERKDEVRDRAKERIEEEKKKLEQQLKDSLRDRLRF